MGNMNSIYDRIQDGEFTVEGPYARGCGRYGNTEWTSDTPQQRLDRLASYRNAVAECTARFRSALEEEYGTASHPKAELLWQKAWEHGHSSGYTEVLFWYDDLYQLIQ